jgi:hypothetical protein
MGPSDRVIVPDRPCWKTIVSPGASVVGEARDGVRRGARPVNGDEAEPEDHRREQPSARDDRSQPRKGGARGRHHAHLGFGGGVLHSTGTTTPAPRTFRSRLTESLRALCLLVLDRTDQEQVDADIRTDRIARRIHLT